MGKIDSKNRNIKVEETVKVTFSLKCYEENNFVCKNNQSLIQDCKRYTTYDEHHHIPRLH